MDSFPITTNNTNVNANANDHAKQIEEKEEIITVSKKFEDVDNDNDDELVFVKETPKRLGGLPATYVNQRWMPLVRACKSQPQDWLKVPKKYYGFYSSGPYYLASAVKGGWEVFSPKGTFQARVRKDELFIRYVGED